MLREICYPSESSGGSGENTFDWAIIIMSDAGNFDLGALNRVKSEIDASLHRVAEALGQYRETGDPGKLAPCRTLTHQVRGALLMIGLEGPVQICNLLERVFANLEDNTLNNDPEALLIVEQAPAALGQFLEDLMAGEPNQALRLLPIYRRLHGLIADEPFRPADLFFPDITLPLPERHELVEPLIGEDFHVYLKRERFNYQKGLLALLRNPAGSPPALSGLAQMGQALKSVEASQENTRLFWWVSRGFIDALTDIKIVSQNDAKRLCARIDLQIRRLLEGSTTLAERLIRDELYFISQSTLPEDALGAEVRRTFHLEKLIPETEIEPTTALKENTLRHLRECLSAAERFWNKFCAGQSAALSSFAEQARNCAAATQKLGHPDVTKLGQSLAQVAEWLAEQPSRNSENISMEVATAILLLQNAQANYRRLGADYSRQADLMVSRLDGCMAGTTPAGDEAVPILDDMTRRAQERMLIIQVTREIQSCLGQIEQDLDTFFRSPNNGFDGRQVRASLKQVKGALSMLGQDQIQDVLERCSEQINRFSEPGYQASQDDFVDVAHELSMIGLFVDALQSGPVNYEEFIQSLGEESPPSPQKAEPAPSTVEAEIVQKKEETQELLEALKETPENASIREELKQNLQQLQADADLVDDHALVETTKAALSALATGTGENPELGRALEKSLALPKTEAPAPSAETLTLVQASDEQLEAEFLDIFLEEAGEVLDTIQSELEKLREDPHDMETLTNIRRGTHTLKGSGRMVGLKSFGEFAWSIEQTLNLWIRRELEVTPEILELISRTHHVGRAWIDELTRNSGSVPDASELIAFSEQLRAEESAESE